MSRSMEDGRRLCRSVTRLNGRGEKGPMQSEVGPKIDGVKTPYTADLYGANKLHTNTQQ
jgi:hypothetical protein